MRRASWALLTAVILGVLAAAATAQDETAPLATDVRASVTPKRAGTEPAPRRAELHGSVAWSWTSADDPPRVESLALLLPRRLRYDARGRPMCSVKELDRKGREGCPRGSIIGRGTLTAEFDTTGRPPIRFLFFNGGGRTMHVFKRAEFPFVVEETSEARLVRTKRGRQRYKLNISLQFNKLMIAAWVPYHPLTFDFELGAPGVGRSVVSTTGCPSSGSHGLEAESRYSLRNGPDGSITARAKAPCR